LPPGQVLAQVINTVQISCTSLAVALCFAAGARRPGSRRILLLQAVDQGRQGLPSRELMASTEAGQSLQECQRASDQQKKRYGDFRKLVSKTGLANWASRNSRNGSASTSSGSPSGASSATGSEGR
jgi:hypothetical protein